jgi:hypothetical protein
LFLVTVADAEGLSYYSDRAIGRHLKMDCLELSAARQQLVQADLLAYQNPLSGPLCRDPQARGFHRTASGQARSVGDILAALCKEVQHDRLPNVLSAAPALR